MPNRIVFIGSGGGGGIILTQVRKTGGIFIELDDVKFVIDPGPGCVAYSQMLDLKPEEWDGALLSHLHLDHVNDINVLADGIEDLFVIAERHCLKQTKYGYPVITKYHQQIIKKSTYSVAAGEKVRIKNIVFEAVKADHYSPAVGFVIHGSKKIGYTSDGTYYRGQGKKFDGCDVLIMNVMVPKGFSSYKGVHMSVDDAIKIIREMKKKPKLAILWHLGYRMISSDAQLQAKFVTLGTKVPCVAAEDFMQINIDKIKKPTKKKAGK